MPDLRLGKLPARHDSRTLQLRSYLPAAVPAPPAARSWDHGVTSWGVMRNDALGCCTVAAVGHAVQVATVNASTEVTIADADIVTAYSAVSGYNPATGANDNGAYELDVLKYWQTTGVAGHHNAAYAACSLTDRGDIEACINLFGFAYIGFNVPASAMQQFSAGKPWDVVSQDGGIVGGHAVICVDYDATGLTCITWGKLQRLSWAFWTRYVDEVYGVVLPEWVAANGTSPSGLNLKQLLTDVQQLQQSPDPAPVWKPDPAVSAWLQWRDAAGAYVAQQYATGNLAGARSEEAVLAQYEPQIVALLQGQAANLPARVPAVPR